MPKRWIDDDVLVQEREPIGAVVVILPFEGHWHQQERRLAYLRCPLRFTPLQQTERQVECVDALLGNRRRSLEAQLVQQPREIGGWKRCLKLAADEPLRFARLLRF